MTKLQRAIKQLSFSCAETFDQLLDSKIPSVFTTHAAHRAYNILPLLPGSEFTTEIQERHFESPDVPKLGLGVIPNALISGSSFIGTETDVWQMPEMMPAYVDKRLATHHSEQIAFPINAEEIYVSGLSVLLTHWNTALYGHWLLEGMPKLLLLRTLGLQELQIIIPESSPNFIGEWINMILPEAKLIKYNQDREFVRCERVLLPTMLCSRRYFYHRRLSKMIDDTWSSTMTRTHGKNRLYVSRDKPSPRRVLTNKIEIEGIAAENGFTIIIPEHLPVADQISLFQNTDVIVGDYGSAMHNTIFSPRGSVVLCLNWLGQLQGRVAHLREQHVGYLLPRGGQPVRLVEGQTIPSPYSIEPVRFARLIRQIAG